MRQCKSILLSVMTLSILLLLSVPVQAQDPLDSNKGVSLSAFVPGDYIVIFREWTTPTDRGNSAHRAGASVRFNYSIVHGAAVHIPNDKVLATLQGDPSVAAVIPDRKVYAHARPGKGGGSTPAQVIPAGIARIGATPDSGSKTGRGIGVAVVDTGIDFNHGDLLPVGGPCFTAFSSCQDDNGHGTHVTGIIAARNNTIDVVGVAPEAIPYAVKVLDQTGSGSDATVIGGLDWIYQSADSVTPPIRIVNMSLGRPGTLDDDPLLRQAVQKVVNELGISIVVSAGNDPEVEVSQQVPATYPEVMAVASTTARDGSNKCKFFNGYIQGDTASYFTTDGTFDPLTRIGVTISAPGETQENISPGCLAKSDGILSTKLSGGTTKMSGTSMSAPHVAGVVARILESGQMLPEDVRAYIRTTADRRLVAPLDSPTAGYTFDNEREGIVLAP